MCVCIHVHIYVEIYSFKELAHMIVGAEGRASSNPGKIDVVA